MNGFKRRTIVGKMWVGIIFIALVVSFPTVFCTGEGSQELIFYISTDGNDSWSGTIPSPNQGGTDGPFATVTRAQIAVRNVRVQEERPVTVLIRGGVYELQEPLMFTPEDSGSEQAPVTYAAYPGEHPIFSGGSVIRGWQKDDGPLWTAEVPQAAAGQWYFHQLFVDGQRQTRARTPNEGYLHIAGTLQPLLDRDKARGDERFKIGFRYQDEDLDSWHDLEEVNIFLYHSWTCSVHWIDHLDEKNHTVRFTNPSVWPLGWWDAHERYHVENYLEALDAPGEWYLDRETGTLTYWPQEGKDPNQLQVVAPRLQHLLVLQGDADLGLTVDHLILRGLSFQHAEWKVDKAKVADGQAAMFLSAAVVASGARNCVLENCEIAHVGEYALILGQGCKYNRIIHCEIHDMGGGGVRIGQTSLPQEPERQTDHNVVDNCFIHSGGHVFRAGIGVWIGRSSYNTVSHNEICDFYYSGCSVGWSWGYAPSSAHDNIFEYNHIHDLGKGVLSDMGGIYSLGISPGTVERFNLIHDIHSYIYGGWGLYTDEGSSDMVLENNVVYNTKTGSFHQHYGQDNVLRNNILGPALEATIIRSRQEDHLSFTFEHNIVLTDNGNPLGGAWSNGNYKMDYNLYWDVHNLLGEDMDFGGLDFKKWQAAGRDQHSLISNPLFVDAEHHDYRLQNNSQAFQLGFQPFDIGDVGLYGEAEWVEAPKKIVRKPIPEFLPPALMQSGPASYPENLSQSGLWIIKYDPAKGRGTIPADTDACTLVWAVNCKFPSDTPQDSQNINGSCESAMKKGLDGIWYVIIPHQEAGAISFKFRDGLWGENWDDNGGKNWWITSREYVHGLLTEFDRVIQNGTRYGADMSAYTGKLAKAWSDYLGGNYSEAMNGIDGSVNAAGMEYARQLLNVTSQELESLRTLGIDVSLDERLLYLAELMIQKGTYQPAEDYCNRVLEDILKQKASISETLSFIALLSAALFFVAREKRVNPR